jgi:hypothetical protein
MALTDSLKAISPFRADFNAEKISEIGSDPNFHQEVRCPA